MSEYVCWCGEPLRLEYGERFIDVKHSANQFGDYPRRQVRKSYAWWRCSRGHLTKAREITPPKVSQ